MSTTTRECELTIGTTRWRMTLGEDEWSLYRDGDLVARWKAGDPNDPAAPLAAVRAWATAGWLEEEHAGMVLALERFAEVMVLQ